MYLISILDSKIGSPNIPIDLPCSPQELLDNLSALILEEKEPSESLELEPWKEIMETNPPINLSTMIRTLLESVEQNNLNQIFKKYTKHDDEDFVLEPSSSEKKQKLIHDSTFDKVLPQVKEIQTTTKSNHTTENPPPQLPETHMSKTSSPLIERTPKQKSVSVAPKKSSSLSVRQRLHKKLNSRKRN